MTHDSYVTRKSQLMKRFDRSVGRIERMLIARFGKECASALIRDSRKEYESLIPQILYIGDRNPFLVFLLPTSRYLAVYRQLKRQGRTVEDTGQLIYEMGVAELTAIPRFVRRMIGHLWFSRWFLGRLKWRAAESQERKYPGGVCLDLRTR